MVKLLNKRVAIDKVALSKLIEDLEVVGLRGLVVRELRRLRTTTGGMAAGYCQAFGMIVDQAMVERGARWLEDFAAQYPRVHELIMSLLDNQPETVIDALAAINPNLRHLRESQDALNYVGLLQERLRNRKSA